MGAEIRLAAKTSLGEPVMLTSAAAYRLWAASYDQMPNPVTTLERRVLRERIVIRPGERWFDLGTGTGFWLDAALVGGADAFGVDLSPEMLRTAAENKMVCRRLICADLQALPIRTDWADVGICSFVLSYCSNPARAIGELARVARTVIVSDLHPDAFIAGWTRSFHVDDESHQIEYFPYTQTMLDCWAAASNLKLLWRIEAPFGVSERRIFVRAGKETRFDELAQMRAILCSAWVRA